MHKNRYFLISLFSFLIISLLCLILPNVSVKAAFNYPAYKFPWRAGEIWQERPYDIHRDAFGLALDFVPVKGSFDVLAMAPGRVTRGCTTADNMQTLVWIETISRGINYGERIGYFHLDPESITVENGDYVRQGEVIGTIASNIKDYSNDQCNLMSWYEPHVHVSLPENAFPITIDGQIFEAPESEVIFSGPVDKTEEKYRYTNYRSSNSMNRNGTGLFVGARVKSLASVNMRNSPSSYSLGRQSADQNGEIVNGPSFAVLGDQEYAWWQVQWADGQSGWSVQDYLTPRRVVANASVNVRYLPAENRIGYIYAGQGGILSGGPIQKEFNGFNYTWVRVDWDDGSVGWSPLGSGFVRIIN